MDISLKTQLGVIDLPRPKTFPYRFLLITLGSFGISLTIYAFFLHWTGAIALLSVLFLHESGHMLEINRQGARTTWPIFIPFLGAVILSKTPAESAWKQALIGSAGPLAGSITSLLILGIFELTHIHLLLVMVVWGCLINLLNLVPAGQLDGGWMLSAVNKHAHLLGVALLVAYMVYANVFSVLLVLVILIGIMAWVNRIRGNDKDRFAQTTKRQKTALLALWLAMVVTLVALLGEALLLLGRNGNLF